MTEPAYTLEECVGYLARLEGEPHPQAYGAITVDAKRQRSASLLHHLRAAQADRARASTEMLYTAALAWAEGVITAGVWSRGDKNRGQASVRVCEYGSERVPCVVVTWGAPMVMHETVPKPVAYFYAALGPLKEPIP